MDPTTPEPPPPSIQGAAPATRTHLVLLLMLGAWAWVGSFYLSGFALDDREILFGNPVVEGELPWSSVVDRDYWHHRGDAGHLRPSATATLRLDRAIHGEDPGGYHLTNLVLHLLVIAMAWLVIALWAPWDARILLWGLGLFAAHPALADSVAWISGRTSMLGALPGLAGLAGVLAAGSSGRRDLRTASLVFLATSLGLVGALMGKEDGLVFAPLMILAAVRTGAMGRVASLLGVSLSVLAYLGLRWWAVGSPWPSAPHAPLADAALIDRVSIAGRAFLEGLRILVWPLDYPPNYGGISWTLESSPEGIAGALAVGVLGGLGCVGLRRPERRGLSISMLALVLALFPVSQVIPAGEVFAPRFLYLPLLLGAGVSGLLLANLPRGLSLALLIGCVPLAWFRADTYRDSGKYWGAVLEANHEDPRAWNALGIHYQNEGELHAAAGAYRQATELDPRYSRAWTNLGHLLIATEVYEEALTALARAVREGPRNPIAHLSYGAALLRVERYREARDHYRRATEIAPGLAAAWRGWARAEHELGHDGAARSILSQALRLSPKDAIAHSLQRHLDRNRGDGDETP